MKTSKQKFEKWLNKQTKKFRKSKPKWATHYTIHENKVRWLKFDNGFFFEKPKKVVCLMLDTVDTDTAQQISHRIRNAESVLIVNVVTDLGMIEWNYERVTSFNTNAALLKIDNMVAQQLAVFNDPKFVGRRSRLSSSLIVGETEGVKHKLVKLSEATIEFKGFPVRLYEPDLIAISQLLTAKKNHFEKNNLLFTGWVGQVRYGWEYKGRLDFEEKDLVSIIKLRENEILKETKNKYEAASVFDADGNIILNKTNYKKDEVSFTNNEIDKIKKSQVLTHNHPGSSSLSLPDVNFALAYGIKEVRAIAENSPYGKIAFFIKNISKETIDSKKMVKLYNDYKGKIRNKNATLVELGKLDSKYFSSKSSHETWVKVSKELGFDYGFEDI